MSTVFSAPDRLLADSIIRGSRLKACLALLGLALAAGCQHSKPGPFADVAGHDRQTPTQSVPATEVTPPPTEAAAAQPQVVPAETQPSGSLLPADRKRISIAVDAIGATRDWPAVASVRPSGDVVASPYYWPTLENSYTRRAWQNIFLESGELILNSALLPYRMVKLPPWKDVVYSPVGPTRDGGVIFGQSWIEPPAQQEP